MSYDFHVGQRVVCVDAVDAPMLFQGTVYTIREIGPVKLVIWRNSMRESVSILLCEAEPAEGTLGFAPERFRPLDERRLDIFRAHLTKAPKSTEPA